MVYIYKNGKRLGRLFVKKSILLLFSWTNAERRLAWLVEKIFRHWDAWEVVCTADCLTTEESD